MKLFVLAAPKSWYLRDLQRAGGTDHEVLQVAHGQLESRLGASPGPRFSGGHAPLDAADAILVRTMEGGSLEQVVFRMDVLGQLEALGKVVVNSARAVETAVDKYLAAAKCHTAGLLVPSTVICQTTDNAMQAYFDLGEDVVVKPLFGGEGRGIFRVSDPDCAHRAFKSLARLDGVLYLQPFIPHEGYDLRLFVIGRQVLGMKRRNPNDWRSNVSRGAVTEPLEVTESLRQIALQATSAVGTEIAGVDVLPARDGSQYVLEVNAVPGWQALARTLQVDIAALVLKHVQQLVVDRAAIES